MGFWAGIEKGWQAFEKEFEAASESAGAALGRGLPWLIVIGVVGLLLLGTCAACLS